MASSGYTASVNVIGIQDKKAQDAIRRVLENCQWLKDELERTRGELQEELKRQQAYFDAVTVKKAHSSSSQSTNPVRGIDFDAIPEV